VIHADDDEPACRELDRLQRRADDWKQLSDLEARLAAQTALVTDLEKITADQGRINKENVRAVAACLCTCVHA
jgi:hypothetical protein